MEAEELMTLRDLPVDTRNYTIVDNITGKPIDQSNYTLTIDPEVIGKLNKLKQVNEEKIKQAALREQYGDDTLVSTFTPTDNAVFTPVYNDEYIDYHDFNLNTEEEDVPEEVIEETVEDTPEEVFASAEITQSDTLLERVVARDPKIKEAEEQARLEAEAKANEPVEELDYITSATFDNSATQPAESEKEDLQADNSLFTPEMATLQQASEQIVNIDTKKLGQDIKTKEQRKGTEKIRLDKMEILAGRGIAWLAYILFFIPLLFKPKNRFVRLHANEGLELNIMELIGALLVGQYFLLQSSTTIAGTLATISLVGVIIGAGLIGVCALTIIPMMVNAMIGRQVQNPWLWKRRIIHVPTERTGD